MYGSFCLNSYSIQARCCFPRSPRSVFLSPLQCGYGWYSFGIWLLKQNICSSSHAKVSVLVRASVSTGFLFSIRSATAAFPCAPTSLFAKPGFCHTLWSLFGELHMVWVHRPVQDSWTPQHEGPLACARTLLPLLCGDCSCPAETLTQAGPLGVPQYGLGQAQDISGNGMGWVCTWASGTLLPACCPSDCSNVYELCN